MSRNWWQPLLPHRDLTGLKRKPLYIIGDPRMVRGFVKVDLGLYWFKRGTHYHVIYEDERDLLGKDKILVIEGPGQVRGRVLNLAIHLAHMGRLRFLAPDDIQILQLIQMAAIEETFIDFLIASAPE